MLEGSHAGAAGCIAGDRSLRECSLEIQGSSRLLIQEADEGEVTYRKPKGGMYMSVFALTESVGIEYLRGVKYPLVDYRMVQSFPIGVSNEIIGGQAYLEIESGLALIIQS